MSRIGKQPVAIPSGVKAALQDGVVHVEGPIGKMQFRPGRGVSVAVDGGKVVVQKTGGDKQSDANFGTARALINNMVIGVSKGWKRNLELNGVGFSAKLQGKTLVLTCGFSHDVEMPVPEVVKATVDKTKIELVSCDRQAVGTFASNIRRVQPPEPYLGKGIKYAEETVRRKAGKTGKK